MILLATWKSHLRGSERATASPLSQPTEARGAHASQKRDWPCGSTKKGISQHRRVSTNASYMYCPDTRGGGSHLINRISAACPSCASACARHGGRLLPGARWHSEVPQSGSCSIFRQAKHENRRSLDLLEPASWPKSADGLYAR